MSISLVDFRVSPAARLRLPCNSPAARSPDELYGLLCRCRSPAEFGAAPKPHAWPHGGWDGAEVYMRDSRRCAGLLRMHAWVTAYLSSAAACLVNAQLRSPLAIWHAAPSGSGGASESDLLIQGALMREGSQAGSWGGRGAIPPNTDLPVSGACLKAHSE